jgi:hypothetical protein
MKKRVRIPETVNLPIEFHAKKDHVVGVIWLGESSIGIRFNSPEHILEFMSLLMEKAVLVWPDNEWIKEYLSD